MIKERSQAWLEALLATQYFLSLPKAKVTSHFLLPCKCSPIYLGVSDEGTWGASVVVRALFSSSMLLLLLGHSEPLTHFPGFLFRDSSAACSLHSNQYFPLSETDHLLRGPASAPLALGGTRCRGLFPINLGVLEEQRPRVYNLLVIRNPNSLGQSGLYLGPDSLLPASLGHLDKC